MGRSKIKQRARKQASSHAFWVKACSFISAIVVPLVISLLIAFKATWFGHSDTLFWLLLILISLIALLFFWQSFANSQSTFELMFEAEDLQRDKDDAIDISNYFEGRFRESFYISRYLQEWIKQIPAAQNLIASNPGILKETLNDLFSPITHDDNSLFPLANKEHIKFVLYLFDEDENSLIPVWKHETTSGRKINTQLSRRWKPCEGHVGMAFAKKNIIFTPDATLDGIANFFAAPTTKAKTYDPLMYQSFVSVPLKNLDDDARGVLVATSNIANRFDQNTAEIVVAAALAVQAILVNIDTSDLMASNAPV